jgi:hypothetical protein
MNAMHHNMLKNVRDWPHALVGVFEIVHCSDPIDGEDIPSFSSGYLIVDGDIEGPSLCIESQTFYECGVDFDIVDKGSNVEVSVIYDFDMNAALRKNEEYGYKVVKIRCL